MSDVSHCRYCGQSIRWVKTLAGRNHPLDAEPSFKGNARIIEEDGTVVFGKAAKELSGPRFISHWATCVKADEVRKAKR